MNRFNKSFLMLLLALAVSLPACADKSTADATSPAADSEIAAYVGDDVITMTELEETASTGLKKLEQERYELFRRTLEAMATERLVAKEAESRGMTVEEFLLAEVDDKAVRPTDEKVAEFYEINKSRMGGQSLDKMRPDLSDYLWATEKDNVRKRLFQNIRSAASVQVMLDPPRSEIPSFPGEPFRGPEDAPITMVEFADFECPYCRRAHPAVERVLTEYGDRIKFVFRDYPLAMHQRAVPASEAARCADDQGKFWDYYENLMVMRGDLGEEDLKKRAQEVGLDAAEFTACMRSGRHNAAVRQGFDNGESLGVTGTPTFFINGRMMVGAKSYEDFKAVIEDELERAGTTENVGG